jgi:hypothetical protein
MHFSYANARNLVRTALSIGAEGFAEAILFAFAAFRPEWAIIVPVLGGVA